MNDIEELGLDCFSVDSLYLSHTKKTRLLTLKGVPIASRGIYHLLQADDTNSVFATLEKSDDVAFCVINQNLESAAEECYFFSHVDAFSLFVKSTHKHIEYYVVMSARSLVDTSELAIDKATKRSGVVKNLYYLKQIADYYNVKILLLNEVVDGDVYLDSVIKQIEKDRVYL